MGELPDFLGKRMKGNSGPQIFESQIKHIATLQKPADIVNQALDRTLGCHPFNQIFRGSRNVLIVMPDPAEGAGAEFYLPLVRERLNRLHVPDQEIRILVTAGADSLGPRVRATPPLSSWVGDAVRVFWHDPRDHKSLEYAGLTKRGTPVFINRLLLETDAVLLCGNVTHHPFAGYGGGPRLIVPGCAGAETIRRHFAHALDAEMPQVQARCRDASVEGNPLQEDSREAFRFITVDFLLHTVLNDQQQIVGAVAGEPLQAFAAGCKAIDNMFALPIPSRMAALPATPEAGVMLVLASCGGAPYDDNFRSAYATLHRATQTLRTGGVVIWMAECPGGIGSPALSNWLSSLENSIPNAENETLLSPSPGLSPHLFHHQPIDELVALATLQRTREFRIIMVTALEARQVQRLGCVPAQSLQEALEIAKTWLPAAPSVPENFSALLLSNGTLILPHLS
ncbi:MAG: Lactate racemase [bacterium]|nr:Lactate racemase [bacterium]